MSRSNWWDDAACANSAPYIDFFTFDPDEQMELKKGWCADCPVKKECLEDALEHEGSTSALLREGIWGGMTGPERYAESKARRMNGRTVKDVSTGVLF